MLVLAVDSASAATSAAIAEVTADGVTVIAAEANVDARAHGEVLAPLIQACLATAGRAPGELNAIVAGVGPGPFTGLRVGLVTAAALGDALTIPTYGVCSLDAIGCSAGPSGESRLLVAADARRREVYWAGYRHGVRDGDPMVTKPAELDLEGYTAMAGSGARLYADALGLPLLDQDYPDLGALVAVAAERVLAQAPAEQLTPLYLRRPDIAEPSVRKSVL